MGHPPAIESPPKKKLWPWPPAAAAKLAAACPGGLMMGKRGEQLVVEKGDVDDVIESGERDWEQGAEFCCCCNDCEEDLGGAIS